MTPEQLEAVAAMARETQELFECVHRHVRGMEGRTPPDRGCPVRDDALTEQAVTASRAAEAACEALGLPNPRGGA